MKTKSCAGNGKLSIEFLAKMAQRLKLLAHPHRLKIVEILETGGDAPVFEIARQLGLSQAATSQHLNQMRRMELVGSRRNGKEVRYTIGDRRAVKILSCIRGSTEGS
jgi:DNA-binding transcriptional ArsR family regulator